MSDTSLSQLWSAAAAMRRSAPRYSRQRTANFPGELEAQQQSRTAPNGEDRHVDSGYLEAAQANALLESGSVSGNLVLFHQNCCNT